MIRAFIKIFILPLLCIPVIAFAQSDLSDFENRLRILNQTPISQSPRFISDEKMFSMRVLDNNRQLVGSVEDIQIDEGGMLIKLVSEINNVGRVSKIVQNNSFEITFHDPMNAFEIPLALKQNSEIDPRELAAISPAAGGGKIFGLKALLEAEVRSQDGRWLGEVTKIMFDEQAIKVDAIVLQDVPGARRYKEIAIPFDPEHIQILDMYGRPEFRLSRHSANLLKDVVEDSR